MLTDYDHTFNMFLDLHTQTFNKKILIYASSIFNEIDIYLFISTLDLFAFHKECILCLAISLNYPLIFFHKIGIPKNVRYILGKVY